MTTTQLMGILNVTPDSFSDGGLYLNPDRAIARIEEMVSQGVDIVDVGAESTKPGSQYVSEEEEMRRLVPVFNYLKKHPKISFSVDTRKPAVAEVAIEAGCKMINDISGGENPEMQELIASSGILVCLMHMKKTPETMQQDPSYTKGVIPEIMSFLRDRVDTLIGKGVQKEKIILDPGIGFGKTVAHNLEILQNLPKLNELGYPLLLGISRKSFMQKILKKTAAEVLPSTIGINALLIEQDVDYIRVHDVAEHRQLITVIDSIKGIKR